MAHNVKRVGALSMPDAKAHASFLDAGQAGRAIVEHAVAVVNIQKDIERAIASYSDQPDSGLIVFPHPTAIPNRRLISSLAERHQLPAIYPYRYFAANEDLITYGPDQIDQWRGAAITWIVFSRARNRPTFQYNSDKIRDGDQSQDGKGAKPDSVARPDRQGRRGGRIKTVHFNSPELTNSPVAEARHKTFCAREFSARPARTCSSHRPEFGQSACSRHGRPA